MPLTFNLRHLEEKDLHLEGELPAEELDLQGVDELIHAAGPLQYNLTVQRMGEGVLVEGNLSLNLRCECARCLKPFEDVLNFDHWVCHLALSGPESAKVVNDCVDLTPHVREDILLAFPQQPLCKADCSGLPQPAAGAKASSGAGVPLENSSAWAELNKLKLK
jgi:uncharacterized metal-binding protein YceD (DUF177 family)